MPQIMAWLGTRSVEDELPGAEQPGVVESCVAPEAQEHQVGTSQIRRRKRRVANVLAAEPTGTLRQRRGEPTGEMWPLLEEVSVTTELAQVILRVDCLLGDETGALEAWAVFRRRLI
jgi:hypothetical protein